MKFPFNRQSQLLLEKSNNPFFLCLFFYIVNLLISMNVSFFSIRNFLVPFVCLRVVCGFSFFIFTYTTMFMLMCGCLSLAVRFCWLRISDSHVCVCVCVVAYWHTANIKGQFYPRCEITLINHKTNHDQKRDTRTRPHQTRRIIKSLRNLYLYSTFATKN